MIKILGVTNAKGAVCDVEIPSSISRTIDAGGLHILPALIDSHVHFRQPGHEWKEDWGSAAQAAITGGVTSVIDMPNNVPSIVTQEALTKKKRGVVGKLASVDIPLRDYYYFGADRNHIDEIKGLKGAVGIKLFMGSSTGNLLIDDLATQKEVFAAAAKEGLPVAVHAEDEEIIRYHSQQHKGTKDPSTHSKVRHRSAAIKATETALRLAEETRAHLIILHISTLEEMKLIAAAKKAGVQVSAEVTPHHLFLDESDYLKFGTRVQMNPPLRTKHDREALWEAIHEGVVDFIGTDHAPHTLDEKNRPYGEAPSGVPSIELYLPLLLDAAQRGMLTLEQIVQLTRTNIEKVFQLESNEDYVLVDLNQERLVHDAELKTKCQWSPYHGRILRGWPVMTILRGLPYQVKEVPCRKL